VVNSLGEPFTQGVGFVMERIKFGNTFDSKCGLALGVGILLPILNSSNGVSSSSFVASLPSGQNSTKSSTTCYEVNDGLDGISIYLKEDLRLANLLLRRVERHLGKLCYDMIITANRQEQWTFAPLIAFVDVSAMRM
jgi:hypothetical protein